MAALAAVRLAVGSAGVHCAPRPGVPGGSGGVALRRPTWPVCVARVRLLVPPLGGGAPLPGCELLQGVDIGSGTVERFTCS